MPQGYRIKKRKRSKSIAKKYFAKKRAVMRNRRPSYKSVFGYKKFGRRISRVQTRKYRAMKLGVGTHSDRYQVTRSSGAIIGVANKIHFEFAPTNVGLRDIETLDNIYTNEGFSDVDTKIVMMSEKVSCVMKMQSDMGGIVTIHKLQARNLFTSGFGGLSANIIDEGFSGIGLASSEDQEHGTTIFMNNRLTKYFKVLNSTTLFLKAGEVRKYTMTNNRMQVMDFEYRNEPTFTQKRGTVLLLVEIAGVPVHDNGAGAGAESVGTSAPVLDFYTTKTVKYRIPDRSGERSYNANVSVTVPVGPIGFVDGDIVEQAEET